jgi:hypothetical protein
MEEEEINGYFVQGAATAYIVNYTCFKIGVWINTDKTMIH